MSVTTGRSSIDASGNIYVYAPPNSGVVNRGNSIVNGIYNQVNAGEQTTLPNGIVQFASGSGQGQVVEGGSLTYQVVSIVAGPVVIPGSSLASPQTVGITGVTGTTATPGGYVYQPPNAPSVPIGSQVTYGPVVVLGELELTPQSPVIIYVAAGASPVQAMNLMLWRTVTVVPL